MCGIICILSKPPHTVSLEKEVYEILKNRGPDSSKIVMQGDILLGGFVLWQQGAKMCVQPLENKNTVLVFNGDLYNIDELKKDTASDTTWLSDRLTHCQNDWEILDVLRYVEGPYSLLFYNKTTKYLYFARDSLGRNSLLIEKDSSHLRILSTSYIYRRHSNTIELPPLGLYKLNSCNFDEITIFPWKNYGKTLYNQVNIFEALIKTKMWIEPVCISPDWLSFSLVDKVSYDFYQVCKTSVQSSNELFHTLLSNEDISKELNKFHVLLRRSIESRISKLPNCCQICIVDRKICEHAKIAILFSGGIDCSILAILLSRLIRPDEPIDLLNFSYDNDGDKLEERKTPDRISAKRSLVDLRKLCPSRKWNLVEINIPRSKCHNELMKHIKHLIFPLNTVLDESLGAAFWFAAKGEGFLLENYCYKSSARIVLVGSGADELFGGYRRHRNAFIRSKGDNNEKHLAVQKELDMDWERISSRNLARDDRVIADSKKTPRAPYIEENLVNYVRSLKSYQRSCYVLADGIGDKMFLRLYGYKLGLRYPAFLKKRAIQFGSKIADKKQNASDTSKYLAF